MRKLAVLALAVLAASCSGGDDGQAHSFSEPDTLAGEFSYVYGYLMAEASADYGDIDFSQIIHGVSDFASSASDFSAAEMNDIMARYQQQLISEREAARAALAGKNRKVAEDFLAKMGYSDMEDTYYEVQSNICTINFAYETRGIICYTDLIKVSVALDNGEVLSCDARGYLTNHRDRVVTTPEISKSDAASVVADNLTIEDTELCIIPSGGLNELYCYEFKCRTEEGNTVLVYINADTGTEEQILLLIIGEYGTLTV